MDCATDSLKTPLMMLCAYVGDEDKRHKRILDTLIDNGADVNAADMLVGVGSSMHLPHSQNGETCLHIAALCGNLSTINFLLHRGVRLTALTAFVPY